MFFTKDKNKKGKKKKSQFVDADNFPMEEALEHAESLEFSLEVDAESEADTLSADVEPGETEETIANTEHLEEDTDNTLSDENIVTFHHKEEAKSHTNEPHNVVPFPSNTDKSTEPVMKNRLKKRFDTKLSPDVINMETNTTESRLTIEHMSLPEDNSLEHTPLEVTEVSLTEPESTPLSIETLTHPTHTPENIQSMTNEDLHEPMHEFSPPNYNEEEDEPVSLPSSMPSPKKSGGLLSRLSFGLLGSNASPKETSEDMNQSLDDFLLGFEATTKDLDNLTPTAPKIQSKDTSSSPMPYEKLKPQEKKEFDHFIESIGESSLEEDIATSEPFKPTAPESYEEDEAPSKPDVLEEPLIDVSPQEPPSTETTTYQELDELYDDDENDVPEDSIDPLPPHLPDTATVLEEESEPLAERVISSEHTAVIQDAQRIASTETFEAFTRTFETVQKRDIPLPLAEPADAEWVDDDDDITLEETPLPEEAEADDTIVDAEWVDDDDDITLEETPLPEEAEADDTIVDAEWVDDDDDITLEETPLSEEDEADGTIVDAEWVDDDDDITLEETPLPEPPAKPDPLFEPLDAPPETERTAVTLPPPRQIGLSPIAESTAIQFVTQPPQPTGPLKQITLLESPSLTRQSSVPHTPPAQEPSDTTAPAPPPETPLTPVEEGLRDIYPESSLAADDRIVSDTPSSVIEDNKKQTSAETLASYTRAFEDTATEQPVVETKPATASADTLEDVDIFAAPTAPPAPASAEVATDDLFTAPAFDFDFDIEDTVDLLTTPALEEPSVPLGTTIPEAQKPPITLSLDGIQVLNSTLLLDQFQLLLIHHEGVHALMADDGDDSFLLKTFDSNPIEHDATFAFTPEAQTGNKTIITVQIGQWDGILAVENDTIQLQAEV